MAEKAETVKIVLCGCGAAARMLYCNAIGALGKKENLTVSALVDPDRDNREAVAERFPDAEGFDELTPVPMDGETLVVVASPPRFHCEQTLDALERGAAVLCEKPMATNVAEAESMVARAKEKGVVFAVGHFRRFFPVAQNLKGVLESGALGALRRFAISEGGKFSWPAASDSFFRRSAGGGGIFLDLGIHVVDLILWWLGSPREWNYEDDAMGGVEANCRLFLDYGSGMRGEVRLSRDWTTPNRYCFEFERGTIFWESGATNEYSVRLSGMPSLVRGRLVEDLAKMPGCGRFLEERTSAQCFIEQLENVIGAIRGGEKLVSPGEAGLEALRFITGCYAGAGLMNQPWFSGDELPAAERLRKEALRVS